MRQSPFAFQFQPFDTLLGLQQELERLFAEPSSGWARAPSGRGAFPKVNVFTEAEGAVVHAELPGLNPENLQIQSQGQTLRISGKRDVPLPANASTHRRERWSGEFSRSLEFPNDYDPGRATADYKHGVLSVRVPRHEKARPRQITVSTS